ncbi:hypothetical protein ACHAWF_010231, partial [Thalassiosira exigua]
YKPIRLDTAETQTFITRTNMVLFLQPNAAAIVALLASLTSSDAAYYGPLYMRSRPSTTLGSRMLPAVSSPSFFSRDMRRAVDDIDNMFDTILGDMDEMFYEPSLLSRRPHLNALVQDKATGQALAQNQFGITQDDRHFQIILDVPGAKASDVNLELAGDGRVLKISGESKREDEGIAIHSRFERSFTLPRNVNEGDITAKMEDGILTITAPKYEKEKERIRRIEIVETKRAQGDDRAPEVEGDVPPPDEEEGTTEAKSEADEFIDLDVLKE